MEHEMSTTTNNSNIFITIKKAITCCASRDTFTHKSLLRF